MILHLLLIVSWLKSKVGNLDISDKSEIQNFDKKKLT